MTEINAVAIKLPEFWTNQPDVWFMQTESQFALRGIKDDTTMYHYIVSSLSQNTASRIFDVLSNPPALDKYKSLKKVLINTYGLTRRERASRLLNMPPLGDRKPSALLAEMRSLAGGHTTCLLFEEVFLKQLPEELRLQLALEDFKDLDSLAVKADALWQTTNRTDGIYVVKKNASIPNRAVRNDTRTSTKTNSQDLCFYHFKFGKKARKCISPCNFKMTINNVDDLNSSSMLYLFDNISKRRFLIDTGAQISVIPAVATDRDKSPVFGPTLSAANKSQIKTYGDRNTTLKFSGQYFKWKFTIADVTQPLIGADFLRKHNLLVDIKGRRLVDAETYNSLKCNSVWLSPTHLGLVLNDSSPYKDILSEFSDVFTPNFSSKTSKHGVTHTIPTTGPPLSSRARRLPPEKLDVAREEFSQMERMGIIRRSSSQWSSPLHMVAKPDGKWRPCGDYRRLNNISIPDRYPVPHIHDFSSRLQGSTVFSKIDLIRGYYHIPVAEPDVPKTAIITPFGLFEFLKMPFGLKNAPQTFQRFMDEIFKNINFVFIYLDDVLIFSRSIEEHSDHLRQVFKILSVNGLVANLDKCQFGKKNIEFLGHQIIPNAITPLSTKIKVIKEFPLPKNIKQLQEFLGMVNFYHRFLKGIASTMRPMYALLSKSTKNLCWNKTELESFEQTKEALSDRTMLNIPLMNAKLALTTDASDTGIGAVLEQNVDGYYQPLAFFSKKLRPAEEKYSAFDKELLALYVSIRHFRYYLEGRPFTIYTDHKPLTFVCAKTSDAWSARQQRHISYVSEYTTDIQHIEGKNNKVADSLSRINIESLSFSNSGIDYNQLATDQTPTEMEQYRSTEVGLRLQNIILPSSEQIIVCDISTSNPRPVVPEIWQRRIFEAFHNLSHPSIRETTRLISSKFVWKGLRKQVRDWAKSCVPCQTSKVQFHTKSDLVKLPMPNRRFNEIHVDIVGPLPHSQGSRYIITMIDRFTRWPEAIPVNNISAEECAKVLITHWISRFGLPSIIHSDRGTQFTSELWASMAKSLGIQLYHTSAYHPQSNGLVERFHRQLKAALRTRGAKTNWVKELPWVLLGIRTALKEDIGSSAAELVYGFPLTIPGDFLDHVENNEEPISILSQLREKLANLTPKPTSNHGNPTYVRVPKDLNKCEYIFIRHDAAQSSLNPPYDGPFKVIKRGSKNFTIELGHRQEVVSIDRLKPAYIENSENVNVPIQRKRGRPPKNPTQPPNFEGGSTVADRLSAIIVNGH